MAHSFRKTLAEINCTALRHNVRSLRKVAGPEAFFCPMVKSDGYGHGDIEVAQVIVDEGVKHLGVALVEEGVTLKEANIAAPEILVFGPFNSSGAREIVDRGLIPVVSGWDQLAALQEALPSGAQYPCHLKFNTGMYRLGFQSFDAEAIAQKISGDSRLRLVGIATHLSNGEDGGRPEGRTEVQLNVFRGIISHFPKQGIHYHAYNSAGMTSRWSHGLDLNGFGARPGISIYGIDPGVESLTDQSKNLVHSLDLQPVMSLKSEVVLYNKVKKGDRVSYGGRWTAPKDSCVAVVPIGYADGYSRHFSNCGRFLYRGRLVPVVGTVCMDYTMVDVTEAVSGRPPEVGEEVVILGEQEGANITASDAAELIGTIPYEIVTCVGPRVPRTYRD